MKGWGWGWGWDYNTRGGGIVLHVINMPDRIKTSLQGSVDRVAVIRNRFHSGIVKKRGGMIMTAVSAFDEQQLQAVCDVIADTDEGLTGSEIGRLLSQCGIDDPSPGITKRFRLYQALSSRQRTDQCANNVVRFIYAVMSPVRFVDKQDKFALLKDKLNSVLIFAGLELGSDGKLYKVTEARTLTEAEQRAGRLRAELLRRGVHPDVLRYCQAELLKDNAFHGVLEATKSVAEKIRQKTGLTSDGAQLVDEAFGVKAGPKLAFNSLQTDSETSEHTGLMNLIKGMFGVFRNPTAHAPRISWVITDQDAIDMLTTISMIHRRLDKAVLTGK
jgi:uncharacterized protein (TIGR02391 family)